MKTITLNNTNLSIPEIGMGCMRIVELENADAVKSWVDTALEHGINFFDHADIYGKGRCEEFISETYVFHLNFLGGNSTDICSTRYLVPIMNQEFAMPCLITGKHSVYASLRKVFDQITSLYDENVDGYELALKALLLQAIFLLLQYSKKITKKEKEQHSEKLKSVLDYIGEHYAEPISIAELAELCYFSEYHFMRFFKKHMNMTCVEYMNNFRLEKAVELFEQGHLSIIEVSMSVGFRNLSYFHRAFKKKYGMTPLTFINKLKNTVR